MTIKTPTFKIKSERRTIPRKKNEDDKGKYGRLINSPLQEVIDFRKLKFQFFNKKRLNFYRPNKFVSVFCCVFMKQLKAYTVFNLLRGVIWGKYEREGEEFFH